VAARNHGSQRRHRGRNRIATGKANVFGFWSGAQPFVTQRKNTKSLAARAGGCGAHGQPIPSANAMRHTNGQVLVNDVAARDVQAATSPENRIAPALKDDCTM